MIARYLSIALAAVAVLWPGFYLLRLNNYVDDMRARGLAVEGKEVANGFMMVVPTACVLALIACALAWAAYLRLPRPRPRNQQREVWLITSIGPLWVVLSLPLFILING